jgi:hypothetical protein
VRGRRARATRVDPLGPEQRAAVRSAGAVGLSLVGAGTALVWGLVVTGAVLLIVRAVFIDLFSHADWGAGAVAWVEQLDLWWAVPIVLGLLLAAGGSVWLGIRLSLGRMRRAGVVGAGAVTARGAVLGTALQAALSTLSSWLLGLVVLLTGGVGFWLVAAIWVVLSIALSTLIGWVAGPMTWLAIARREARRAAVA